MPITFPRPARAARDVARALFADQPEVTFSTKDLPGADGDRPTPYVLVRADVRSRTKRLDGRALLRVSVWLGDDEGATEELAALIEARLLDYEGGPEIRGFSEGAGPVTTFDEEAGLWLAFFSITARLRPGSTP